MSSPTLHIDVAILGGGIAGLWALNLLRQQGFSAALFEADALGSGQTIGSQGIIHGGIKYALGGALTPGSEAIAAMPATWRDCLQGRGAVDLRSCKLLSEACYLWSTGGTGSRLNGFLASKLIRGRVEALQPADYPPPLQHPDYRGSVYRLPDPVVDVSSLLETLRKPHAQSIFKIDWRTAVLQRHHRLARLELPQACIEAQCLLLTAGSGNETLIRSLDAGGPSMQRRPLQQVLVKHEYDQPLFGHCIGRKPSPRLTISSHHTQDGQPLWYLGGDLATAAAGEAPDRLIQRAREEVRTLLPWIDLGNCEWSTLSLDRAEPQQTRKRRPAGAFLAAVDGIDNALVAWPGKLALVPRLGEQLLGTLRDKRIRPRYAQSLSGLQSMPRPELAAPCWDTSRQ